MFDGKAYKKFLTSLIKKQMLILGPAEALKKARTITGLKVDDDGNVSEISGSSSQITDEILTVFMGFPEKVAAKELIAAKAQEEKELRHQVESGWMQIENEKAHLVSALDGLALGLATTDEELKILTKNPAFDKVLGGDKKDWTVDEMQSNIGDQYYLPIECSKCMETGKALIPTEVNFGKRRLRIFISPIKRQSETTGVTIMIQDLGVQAPIV